MKKKVIDTFGVLQLLFCFLGHWKLIISKCRYAFLVYYIRKKKSLEWKSVLYVPAFSLYCSESQRIKYLQSIEACISLKAAEQNDVFHHRKNYPLEC